MKKKYWLVLVVLAVVLVGAFFWYKKNKESAVNTEAIKRGTIIESVYGIGTLTSSRSLSIKSGVTSSLHKLYVKEGQIVEKNESLVELEGIGLFKAPFAGTVVSAPFKEGEIIYAQTSVVTLVDPKGAYLLVSLEQQGALNLKPDLFVKISFDGLREQVFDGKVESIFSNGADFLAHISLKTIPDFILAGMTADVAIILQEKKDSLLIPVASLELKNAVISRGGKVIKVPVTIGLVDGAYAEVLTGDVQVGDEAVLIKRELK